MFNLLSEGYYAARGEEAKRNEMQKYYDVKRRQRRAGFGFAAQLLNLGSSLWDIYEDNSELIKYAEGKGMRTLSSKFTQIFSRDLTFDQGGTERTTSDIHKMKQYDDYIESMNAHNSVYGDTTKKVKSTPKKKKVFDQSPLDSGMKGAS